MLKFTSLSPVVMRFGVYLQPVQAEAPPVLPKIAPKAIKNSESIFHTFNHALLKLERLQQHDTREQSRRNSEITSNMSRQAAKQATFSMEALQVQLVEDLDMMQLEYEDYLEVLRLKAEAEERERKRLQKLEEEERQRVLEEERLRVAEEKRRAEEEARKKAEEESRKKAEEEERRRVAKAKAAAEEKNRIEEEQERLQVEQNARKLKGMTLQAQVQKSLLTYLDHIKDIKNKIVGALDQDKPLKKDMNVIKRKINVKLGQLSTSQRQANSIAHEIVSLVNSVPPKSLQYHWLLNFIAKALVSQAETEVTVKASAAVPLGFLAATFLSTYPEFDYYLLARLVKKCCFVIGYTGSIDSENGRLRMGWRRGGDGKWESEVKYEERVAGILSLWAVMTRFIDSEEYALFNWKAQWRFLARILNTAQELLGDVHYVIVSNWWEAAAKSFLGVFGTQAIKLLHLTTQEWATFGVSKKFGAASRLQVLGEDYLKRRKLNSLKNMDY